MQVAKQISVVIVLLFFNGCAIFNPNQSPQTEVFDPLVERNTQWQKHVNRGNWEFQNQNFPQAVAAYRAALAVKPQSSGVQRKIAEGVDELDDAQVDITWEPPWTIDMMSEAAKLQLGMM